MILKIYCPKCDSNRIDEFVFEGKNAYLECRRCGAIYDFDIQRGKDVTKEVEAKL